MGNTVRDRKGRKSAFFKRLNVGTHFEARKHQRIEERMLRHGKPEKRPRAARAVGERLDA